ncbi:MAG TPA: YkgJ family cysteine cluster protein [Methanoregula sp.]|nr:YkgJ family cysteine cluster protein [Methanoregula sp.]
MSFTCRQCGECCSTMGEILWILGQTGPDEFRILVSATGEERVVNVDPGKRDLFYPRTDGNARSLACPFLRKSGPGLFTCTVYQSRPDLCRQYACFRILVLDATGRKVGRVMDRSRHFVSADPLLNALWKEKISPADIPDEMLWEEHVGNVLSGAGYRVIR